MLSPLMFELVFRFVFLFKIQNSISSASDLIENSKYNQEHIEKILSSNSILNSISLRDVYENDDYESRDLNMLNDSLFF
jgi:hypothetical protein